MNVNVAIPVSTATMRLYVDKGRKWNAIEHFLLYSISLEPQAAEALVGATNLPWGLVVEVMSRLMRAGWVELVHEKGNVIFRITPSGKSVVTNDTLPAITRPFVRRVGFCIDKVTGTVFRAKELSARSKTYLSRLREKGELVELRSIEEVDKFVPDDVIATLLEEDEHCRGIEPLGSRFGDSFAVVTVSDSEIFGLPVSAPDTLKESILLAAAEHLGNSPPQKINCPLAEMDVPDHLRTEAFNFIPDDLIIGGSSHFAHLKGVLQKSTSWVVIHSTFVTSRKFGELLPCLSDAARRGVRIDILWGKSEEENGFNATAIEVDRCRAMLEDELIRERVRLHTFTTNSHAKLLLADNGRGEWYATVGSCNWLSSSYESLDVSFVAKGPQIVGGLASHLSRMAMGKTGHWTSLVGDLASIAANLKRETSSETGNARARLVLSAQHNDIIQLARDQAERQITVASHKVSKNVDTLIVDPLRPVLAQGRVQIDLIYSEYAHAIDVAMVEQQLQELEDAGCKVQRYTDINVHGKVLLWDDDNVLITSQNLLSADPLEESCAEIGVYVNTPGIASIIREKIQELLNIERKNFDR
jgi:cardiolipin synthase A/B